MRRGVRARRREMAVRRAQEAPSRKRGNATAVLCLVVEQDFVARHDVSRAVCARRPGDDVAEIIHSARPHVFGARLLNLGASGFARLQRSKLGLNPLDTVRREALIGRDRLDRARFFHGAHAGGGKPVRIDVRLRRLRRLFH